MTPPKDTAVEDVAETEACDEAREALIVDETSALLAHARVLVPAETWSRVRTELMTWRDHLATDHGTPGVTASAYPQRILQETEDLLLAQFQPKRA